MEVRVQRSIEERPSPHSQGSSSRLFFPTTTLGILHGVPIELTGLVCRAHGCLLMPRGCWRDGGGAGVRTGTRNATLGGEALGGQWAFSCPREGCSLQLWGQEDGGVSFRGTGPWGIVHGLSM